MTKPAEGSSPCKISRHERYCLARMNGMLITEAHKHAGYKGSNPHQTENMPAIAVRLNWLRTQSAERVIEANAVTRVEVITNAREILQLAKQGTPVCDKDGEPTGVYKPDLSSANKANETLGKTIGVFVDVVRNETFDEELEGKSQQELEAVVLSLLEQLDPNMRKKLLSELDAPVIDMETIGDGEILQ